MKIFNGMKLGFAAAAALACSTPAMAQAFHAGQCDIPIAEFNATLIAEGQRTIMAGNGTSVANDRTSSTGVRTELFMNGITSSTSGTFGYHYETDKPLGTAPTKVCISNVLENMRFYDARQNYIAPEAYLGGRFNSVVDNQAASGARPTVIADTVFGSGTTRRNGLPIVIFGDMTRNIGEISTLLPNGSPVVTTTMMSFGYTQTGLDRLGAGVGPR
jgi:hypothetical protein